MTKLLHSLDFIREEEWLGEDYPEIEQSYSYNQEFPTPNIGEIVEFGWYEEDGEERQRLGYAEEQRSGNIDYTRSEEFRVVEVKTHYHYLERKTDQSNSLSSMRNEVSSKIIITPIEND